MSSALSDLSAFASRLGRFGMWLALCLLAAVAICSLLIVSVGLLLLGLLRALITGKQPKPMMKFNFQNFSAGAARYGPRAQRSAEGDENGDNSSTRQASESEPQAHPRRAGRGRLGSQSGQVVDVEVRELPDRPQG